LINKEEKIDFEIKVSSIDNKSKIKIFINFVLSNHPLILKISENFYGLPFERFFEVTKKGKAMRYPVFSFDILHQNRVLMLAL